MIDMNIKKHGGLREGAGRKKIKNPRNKTFTFTLTEEERDKSNKSLDEIRKKNKLKSRTEALLYILNSGRKDKEMNKNYETTLKHEVAREYGWEIMAMLRRREEEFSQNPLLNIMYKKIGDGLKSLSDMDIEKLEEFITKCRFAKEMLSEI